MDKISNERQTLGLTYKVDDSVGALEVRPQDARVDLLPVDEVIFIRVYKESF